MPKIKVNDINMYYEIHGEGFPLLMINGLATDVNWWFSEMIESFSQTFKTIIFDNRGAGRSDKPDIPYSIQMMANDTIGLMDVLDIKKAHIFGVSMGGAIAQEIAITFPERVEKLILGCASCGGSKAVLPSEEIMQMWMNPKKMVPGELVNELLSHCFTVDFFENNQDFISSYKQHIMKYAIPFDSYRHQIEAGMHFNSGLRLKKISAST
ncbi:MAG: alpha/beta hydrolase [Promethearchaeota archaeon]